MLPELTGSAAIERDVQVTVIITVQQSVVRKHHTAGIYHARKVPKINSEKERTKYRALRHAGRDRTKR